MEENRNLERFVEKILQLQTSQDKTLHQEDLQRIANEMGVSDEEWNRMQKSVQDHLVRAKSFMNYRNWNDAITEAEEATILNPSHPDALFTLAFSYSKRYESKRNPKDKEMAIKYAEDCLEVNPAHDAAAKILSQLRTQRSSSSYSSQNVVYQMDIPNSQTALVMGILSLAGLFFAPGLNFIFGLIGISMAKKCKTLYFLNPQQYTIKSFNNVKTGHSLSIAGVVISIVIGFFILIGIANS